MIDIHAHILPHLDDGAQDFSQSLEMAAQAVESGVRRMVATPHCGHPESTPERDAKNIRHQFQLFRKYLKDAGIPLEVYLGMEIFGTPETPDLLKNGHLWTINESRYPLIEFPFFNYARQSTQILHKLRSIGLTPIVAHPERYAYVHSDPGLLNVWVDMGCLLQLNRGSLMGRFGSSIQALSMTLVDRGFAFTVASDTHGPHTRTPWMADVWQLLKDEFSPTAAALLLKEHPLQVLRNASIHIHEPDWF